MTKGGLETFAGSPTKPLPATHVNVQYIHQEQIKATASSNAGEDAACLQALVVQTHVQTEVLQ